MRKTLVKLGEKELKGEYLFDGTMLFATRRLDGTVINVKDPAVSLFMDFLKVSNLESNIWNYQFFQKKPEKLENYFKSSQDIFFSCFVHLLEELRIHFFRDLLNFNRWTDIFFMPQPAISMLLSLALSISR